MLIWDGIANKRPRAQPPFPEYLSTQAPSALIPGTRAGSELKYHGVDIRASILVAFWFYQISSLPQM